MNHAKGSRKHRAKIVVAIALLVCSNSALAQAKKSSRHDSRPPRVALTAPTTRSTVSGTISVKANASDGVGVEGVQFQLDGVDLGTEDTTAPYSIPWDTTTTTNGTHSLTATARDAAGNRKSAAISVRVANSNPGSGSGGGTTNPNGGTTNPGGGTTDTTAPTASITTPSPDADVSGTVTLSADAADDVGVAGVQFALDGTPLGAEELRAPYSISWDTTTTTDGAHSLTATARDAAGHRTTSASLSVTVSNSTSGSGGSGGSGGSSFVTLPPGSALPSDAECAARVRRSSFEPRPQNFLANNNNVYAQGARLIGNDLYGYEDRVTGNFTGTTDEILQWGACKWGIDENIVRAQAVQESSWDQAALGDCRGGTVPDTHGCQSVGILQVKGANIPPTHPGTWPYAYESTAFNVDYTYAVWRSCYEGKETWLGSGYRAGDEWGCVGRWFSGNWYGAAGGGATGTSQGYISSVQRIMANEVWLDPGF